jgi:hypothetical protein
VDDFNMSSRETVIEFVRNLPQEMSLVMFELVVAGWANANGIAAILAGSRGTRSFFIKA